jgi:D-inositol-3-phosphate glycosyltransferase
MQVKMFDPGNFTPHYVENLCNALAGLDLQVDLITSTPLFEETVSDNRFRVENYFFKMVTSTPFLRRHSLPRRVYKILSYPVGLWRTWRALKMQPPSILHVQWALIPPLDALLIRKLRLKGWRVVYTAHDVNSELASPLRRSLYRRLYRQADAAIVHTPELAAKLRRYSGDVLRDVRVIPEGASTFPLSQDLDRTAARRALGLNVSGPILLFFGIIKRHKGLEYLLRAWPHVVEEFSDARLVIAGESMLPLRIFRRLIDKLKIADSVMLRPGYIPRVEVQKFFCAADAVVLPYIRISTSSVVPTAYRYGCPVIATTAGGLPEIVRDGETGFLVPPCAEQALAQAICRGLRHLECLAQMGARAREWFERERRWDDIARQTAALYGSLSTNDRSYER